MAAARAIATQIHANAVALNNSNAMDPTALQWQCTGNAIQSEENAMAGPWQWQRSGSATAVH